MNKIKKREKLHTIDIEMLYLLKLYGQAYKIYLYCQGIIKYFLKRNQPRNSKGLTIGVATVAWYMLVKLRLQRFGRRKIPLYRVVASPSSVKRDGRFLEIVGLYHPTLEDVKQQVNLKQLRVRHWLDKGAQPTEIVKKLLSKTGFWKDFAKEKQENLIRKAKNVKKNTNKKIIKKKPKMPASKTSPKTREEP